MSPDSIPVIRRPGDWFRMDAYFVTMDILKCPPEAMFRALIPVFTGDLPEGIDCQRCHGPGGQHIRAAQAGAEFSDISSRIVNPARLSSKLQMELCMQCHLEPTSGRLPALCETI